MKAVAARIGVCGNRDDTSGQTDVAKDAAIEQVMAVVHARLTPRLIAAINSPQGAEQLDFHLGKTFSNLEKWFGPK